MNKRAYLFTWDVIIAIFLLGIGIMLIFYNYNVTPKDTYFTEKLSEDIVGVMSYTKLSDLCDSASTKCPRYNNLTNMLGNVSAASRDINYDDDLFTFISFIIETNIADGQDVKDLIHEIFVEHKVVDEKRFGFAILYRTGANDVLEIYNTESYT